MGIKGRNNPKIIIVLGPTASGKSDLAVHLAKKYGGEIISADSRQIYKGMDIGTGKITLKEMKDIPHYLLSVISPKKKFSAAQFKKHAQEKIEQILKRDSIPIICGGTAFYIRILVDGFSLPQVAPDWQLRKKLEKKSADQLYEILKNKDLRRAKSIDKKNKRRLVRALEIIEKTDKPVSPLKRKAKYCPLFIGIKVEQKKLDQRIKKRLLRRLEEGMIKEIEDLHKKFGISWRKIDSFGLEYRWGAKYLQGKISYNEFLDHLFCDIRRYSKTQKRWWQDDARINWIERKKEADKLVQKFLYADSSKTD